MIRWVLSALVLCGLTAGVALPARADRASAQKHIKRAMEHYRQGRYDSAADEFAKAFREDDAPTTLFAWAQAERLADDCKEAISLYGRFLATEPPDSDVEAAIFGIEECEERLAAQPAEDLSGPEADATDNPQGGRPTPWYKDRRGALMTGGGGTLTLIGLGLYLSARSMANNASTEANSESDFDEMLGQARDRRNVAVLIGLAGATLGTLGVLRFRQVHADQQVSLTPWIGQGHTGVALISRF